MGKPLVAKQKSFVEVHYEGLLETKEQSSLERLVQDSQKDGDQNEEFLKMENGDEPLQPVVSGGNSELEGGNENGTMSVGACSSAVYGAMAWPFEKLFELTCPEC